MKRSTAADRLPMARRIGLTFKPPEASGSGVEATMQRHCDRGGLELGQAFEGVGGEELVRPAPSVVLGAEQIEELLEGACQARHPAVVALHLAGDFRQMLGGVPRAGWPSSR